MNLDDSLIPVLFIVTFALALVIGWIQYRKAKKAQREHHRSASAEANHEPRTPPTPAPSRAGGEPRP